MKLDLHSQVTLAGARDAAARLFRWWGGELYALLPPRWRAAHSRWRRRSLLREEGTQWIFTTEGDETSTFALDTTFADDAIREALAQDAPDAFARPLDIALSPDDALIRRIEIPAAAASRLRATVGLQIERLSPFRAEDAGFDCRIVERDEVARKALVEICIVPRKNMRRFEDRLRLLGFSADWFVVEGMPFRIRADDGTARDVGARKLMLAAAGAAILLWLGVAIFTPMARELDVDAVTERIAALRPEAQRALMLKAELDALHQPARLARAKAATPRPVDVLKSVTEILPASVRILEFGVEGSHVTLTGIAKNAPSLIAVLEKSDVFQSAHFRAPVVRRPDGTDRFELDMTVRARTSAAARTT